MTAITRKRLLWLVIFAVAMAELEATVVVYLRELFYPNGFTFPLVIIQGRIAAIEIGREVATIVMLVAVGKITAPRDAWRQFAGFMLAFGVWDIFYYVWLFVMLGWPPSLLTFDVLFLIPGPWIGPCLAPILISAIMIVAALAIERLRDQEKSIRVTRVEWALTVAASVGLIVVFMLDARAVVDGSMPGPFPWALFLVVLAVPMVVAVHAWRRSMYS